MREIKFRAWDKEKNEWIYGAGKKISCFSIIGECTMFDLLNQYKIEKLDNIELEQYIGLKDKNGVEIYEGDIVKVYRKDSFKDFISDVQYLLCGFYVKDTKEYKSKPAPDFLMLNYFPTKVIGNIHENPDLLEGSESCGM